MNNTELANFKKKLSIELETTTSDEAQLISNIVDSASAGALPAVSADDNGKVLTVSSGAWAAAQPSGGGDVKAIILHTNNIVSYPVYAKIDNEVQNINTESPLFIENNLINLDLLENVYLFGTIKNDSERNVVYEYTVVITDNITSDEVPAGAHYIEGGTVLLGAGMACFIPSLDVIK